ncbi:mitochondrial import protein Pam17, partial [Pseudovirgaria hyperparasitica]
SSSSPASEPLTWNRFLALRKTRRRFSLGSSIICAVLTLGIGGSQLLNTDADNAIAAALGTEPMLVWGLSSVVLVAVGWLLGPAFGNGIFKMRYSKHRSAMDAKEREFFLRIKKHRSNPANSSLSNPIPDYYGEKIGSVADYRRWLKDQR